MQDRENNNKLKHDSPVNNLTKELSLLESLIPVFILMALLAYNIFFVEGQEWFGAYTNQYILLLKNLINETNHHMSNHS